MSSWIEHLRSWLATPARRGRSRRAPRLDAELLESRDTPSIVVTGTAPTWQSVGPVGMANASNVILGSPAQNIQIGAINAIAIDPYNSSHLVAATVNGGVWVTTNYAPNTTPTWTPTTDTMPSLAISAVAFNPLQANVVYAGTGSYTAGGLGPNLSAGVNNPGDGGASVGLYRSGDGGMTWTQLGAAAFDGLRIRDVIPTQLNGGNTIFVDTHDGGPGKTGVYRSDDGGVTWTRLSGANGLPDLGVTSMIADPVNPNKFYAAPVGGVGNGVYMLDVTAGNTTWLNISNNLPPAAATGTRILLASTPALTNTGVNPVYAAVVDPAGVPQGVYRAVPFTVGGSPVPNFVWTKIGPGGLPPDVSRGQQGDVHFAIVADPTSDHIVYVAGDRKDLFPFAGNVARGDAIADTWTTITVPDSPAPAPTPGTTTPLNVAPQPTTAPHPDFRGLVFAGTNAILASTDGGVYQVLNPRATGANPPVWSSINGNLRITEQYQADVDDRGTTTTADDVYMAAAQDNGQSEAGFGGTWNEVRSGDGTIVRADSVNGYRYYSAQNFALARRNPNGAMVFPAATVNGGGGSLIGNTPFLPVMTLNQTDTNLMLVGGNSKDLYLSRDHADTFDAIGGGALGSAVPNITSTVTAIAFGTSQIRFAAYVGTDDGNIAQSFDVTTGNGLFALTDFASVAGGEAPVNIVMDPNNPLFAYAITNTRVFRTTNGTNWTDITGNVSGFIANAGLSKLAGLALFSNGTVTPDDDVLLVGGYGGVYDTGVGTQQGAGSWVRLGSGIPNVIVSDLRYDARADTLVAGTYGRGEFRLTGASTAINTGPIITVTGTAGANNMAIYPDPVNSSNFIVSDGIGAPQSYPIDAYRRVFFKGLGGADTVTVGAPDPNQAGNTTPLAALISVDGGGNPGDTLVIQDAADPTGRQLSLTRTTIGAGAGDTLFAAGGSLGYTGLNAGSVQLRLGVGDNQATINDSAIATPVAYGLTGTQFTWAAGTPISYSGVNRMAISGGSAANTYAITGNGAPGGTDITDGAGDSQFTLQGNTLGGPVGLHGGDGNDQFTLNTGTGFTAIVGVDGGAGSDTLNLIGRTTTDAATVAITDPAGGGTITGLGAQLQLTANEAIAYNGNGGTDTLGWTDNTNATYGSLADPASGIVVSPTGLGSGRVTVARGAVLPSFTFTGVPGSININGDGDGSGDRDVLLVLGTSTNGLQSAFGEPTTANGRDVFDVTDQQVSIQNATAGLNLTVGVKPDTLSTLYVFTGNEPPPEGDVVTAFPSTRLNLLVDGGSPAGAARPGDKLTVTTTTTFSTAVVNDPSLGPPQTRLTQVDGASIGLIGFESGPQVHKGLIVLGTGAGVESRVQAYDPITGALRLDLVPFPGFAGGVTVASGDVNGDGYADVIVGAGPGGGPAVSVYSGLDGSLIRTFFAYEPSFTGGVIVSSADMDGDGYADLILGTGVGGGPRVRVLSGRTFTVLRDVMVYEPTFRGGVNVSAGDVNGDGTPDLVTSTGAGGGPRVVVFSGRTFTQIASFFAFDPSSRDGFFAAAGDVNGDGLADVVVGSGAGGPAQVKVFSGLNRSVLTSFILNDPFDPTTTLPYIPVDAGVRVGVVDVNGDGIDDIVTAKGPGSLPVLRSYQIMGVNPTTNALIPSLKELRNQDVFDPNYGFGIFVGGSD